MTQVEEQNGGGVVQMQRKDAGTGTGTGTGTGANRFCGCKGLPIPTRR